MHPFGPLLDAPGRPALGTWIKLPCPETVEIAALAGFDFVVIDCEHAPLSLQTAHQLIGVATGAGLSALVRVPDRSPSAIQRVLDSGAAGVFVPHVDTAADARTVVAAGRFPPDGTRGFGPTCRAGNWGSLPVAEYRRVALEDVACVPQIESPEAVQAAVEIATTPGVTALFLGRADLTVSSNLAPDSPAFSELVHAVEAAARETGLPLGTALGADIAPMKTLAERGYSFFLLSNDATMMASAAASLVSEARNQF